MMKGEVEMSDIEESMLHEAEKTAEFHNGKAAMEREAKRIADMIIKAKFAIAFTGRPLILTKSCFVKAKVLHFLSHKNLYDP